MNHKADSRDISIHQTTPTRRRKESSKKKRSVKDKSTEGKS
jgi:hypothetical protein